MRRFQTFFAVALAMTVGSCGFETADRAPINPRAARDLAAVHLDPSAAVAMLNAYRASRGLKPVRLDPALTEMARRQADAMVAANEMSHDVSGSFPSRLAASRIDTTEAGENLGGGYYSLEDAMSGWRRSPEHDANLKLAEATRFGIALAKDPKTHFGAYWAMEVAAEPRRSIAGSGLWMSPSGDLAKP